jgi:hypothetical protein
VVARHVALFDPSKRRVAVADEVVLIPTDLLGIFHKQIVVKSATLKGGIIHLIKDKEGLPTFLDSFEPIDVSTSTSTSKPLHVVIEDIRLSSVTVYGDMLALKGLRIEDVKAQGSLDVEQDLNIAVHVAQGVFVRPFPYKGYVTDLSGTISGNTSHGIDLRFKAQRDQERANVSVKLFSPDKKDARQRLELRVQGAPISPSTIRGLGFDFMGPLQASMTGTFSLIGPIDDLDLQADLKSDAGDCVLKGRISQAEGVSVSLQTKGLKLEQIIKGAPTITIAGTSDLAINSKQVYPCVRLRVEPILFQMIAIPSFEIEGELETDRLRVDRIFSQERGSEISGEGAIEFDGRMDLTLRARVADIGRDRNVRRYAPGTHGALEADVHVVTPGADARQMAFQGRVVLRDMTYGWLSAKTLAFKGKAHGDPDLPQVDFQVMGEGIALSNYLIGDTDFKLSGGPRDYAAVGNVRVKGQQSFQLDARITADRTGFVLNSEQIELVVGDRSWRGTARNLQYIKDKLVSLELLRLANQTQRLETQGAIRFHGPDEISAQLQDFDLSVLQPFFGKSFVIREGRADANVQLKGDLKRPELSIQGALRDGTLFNLKNVNGVYVVSYQDNKLDIDAEADLGDRGVVGVTGSGILDSKQDDFIEELFNIDYNLAFRATDLDLSVAEHVIGGADNHVQGRVDGEVAARGTLDQPTFSGKVKFDSLAIAASSPIAGEADIDYQSDKLEAGFSLTDKKGPIGTFKGDAHIFWKGLIKGSNRFIDELSQGPWSLSGDTSRRRLDQLPSPISDKLPWPLDLETHFQASKSDKTTYAEVAFDGKWMAQLPQTSCAADIRPTVAGRAVLYDDMAHFTMTGSIGEEPIAKLEGTVQLPIDEWVQNGEFTSVQAISTNGQIDVSSAETFPWLCEYGVGKVHADVDVEQLLTRDVRGHITMTSSFSPKGKFYPENVRRKQPAHQTTYCLKDPLHLDVDAILSPGNIELSSTISGCGSNHSLITATIPVIWSDQEYIPTLARNRDLAANLSLDQADLTPLLEKLPQISQGQAVVNGSVAAKGKLDHLALSGSVDLSHGGFQWTSTGQSLSDITGRFVFRGNWVEVEKLTARDGDGQMKITGGIGLQDFIPKRARVGLWVKDFPFERESIPLAWLSGSATVETEILQQRSATSLLIESLDILLPESTGRSLQSLDKHPDIRVIGVDDRVIEESSPYAIQINLDSSNALIKVRRSDFTAGVRAHLNLIYLEPELRVGGTVDFESGEFESFGKQFELNAGSMFFDGSSDLNPEVSLKATYTPYGDESKSVVATVAGTLQEPEVSFYADECEGEEGALTMLLIGSCSMTESDTVSQDPQAQRDAFLAGAAGGILTLGTSGIRRSMNDLLPTFSVDSYGSPEGQKSYRVQAGVNADSLIPKFMRRVIKHAYVQGGLTTSNTGSDQSAASASQSNTTTQVDESKASGIDTVDFLLELRFPYDLVWRGQVAPPQTWGSDLTWEP